MIAEDPASRLRTRAGQMFASMGGMQLDVTTTAGRVRGRERRDVALFAGIPYAAAPVGELRWAPPAPPERWNGLRAATSFAPAAPQLPGDGLTNAHPVDWSEDCLTLNVVTPAADDGGRPVLVWIHGGAYRHGTGATPWYDGTSFARSGDIVVVSLNYRLGALGFARLDGAPTSGLNGILDQIAALEWVRDNIAAFGGDPGRVTVAGESAGAFSVTTLLALSRAKGLFHRAIPQSGAGHHVVSAEVSAEVSRRLLLELGVADLDGARRCTPVEVLRAQRRVEDRSAEFMNPVDLPFSPCVDGELLADRPIDLLAAGAGAEVAVLTGTNADEMTLFGLGRVTDASLVDTVRHYADPPHPLLEVYREQLPDATTGELAVAMATDHQFRMPAIRLAEARDVHRAPTWMYRFGWKSHAFGGALGATHALEIPFVFNTLTAPGVDVFLGTDELPLQVADLMHRSWIRFIRDGSPEHDLLPDWQPYTREARVVLEYADRPRLLRDPDAAARQAWAGIR